MSIIIMKMERNRAKSCRSESSQIYADERSTEATTEVFEQIEACNARQAERLVGRNDIERLCWLVRFAKQAGQLHHLRPRGFARVSAAVDAFARLSGPVSRSRDEPISPDSVAQLSARVHEWLDARASKRTVDL